MSKTKGYILLWRDIQDCELWKAEPFTKIQAFIDLLLTANYESKSILLGNEVIQAEKGSVITSELKLMERWRWSKEKVRNYLRLLERLEMIERRPDRKKTIIVIRNYEKYQTAQMTDNFQNTQQTQTANQTTENLVSIRDSTEGQTTDHTTNRPQTDHEQTTDRTQTRHYKDINKDIIKKTIYERHKYGEYNNVLLSDEEVEKLKSEYPELWKNKLEELSEYLMTHSKSYKSHYVTIRAWIRKDLKEGEKNGKPQRNSGTELERQDSEKNFGLYQFIQSDMSDL